MICPRAKVLAGQGLRWSLAVLVNTLLNLIDGIAIGQQIFPRTDAFFQQFSIDAVCLYLVTTASAQFVYPMISSFGSAVTAGMMAESLPFLNAISLGIKKGYMAKYPEEENLNGLMATLLAAFSIHGLLISGFFFLLAWLKLEGAVKKCPKYVLLGAMGGIGLFLIKTAVEQSGVKSLWVPMSGLVPALSVVSAKRRYSNPFTVPVSLILLISAFYTFASIFGYTWPDLRDRGLLIPGPSSNIFPLRIYKFLSWKGIEWSLIWGVSPTIAGSAVFAMLHLPINAPSFGRSSKQSLSINRELVANGAINLVTSAFGLLPSYFIYTASVLFIQAGANSRFCSFLLAGTTGGSLLFAIPYMRFIPTCAVGFLLFYLGLELFTESAIDGWELTTNREYGVVVGMMAAMILLGFAQGLLIGIIAAALTTLYDMRTMKANRVNPAPVIHLPDAWPNLNVYSPAENAFLQSLRSDTMFIELPGYYHFANTTETLDTIKDQVLEANARFVLLDMRKTLRVDLNMVEGIQEMITSDSFEMVQSTVCVTKSRRLVKMEAGSNGRLKILPDLGDAVGWVERLQLLELHIDVSNRMETASGDFSEAASLISVDSGEVKLDTLRSARLECARTRYLKAQEDESMILSQMALPTLVSVPNGGILWKVGEQLEAIYIVETGCFEEYQPDILAPAHKYQGGAWMGYGLVRDQQQTETFCVACLDSTLHCYPISSAALQSHRISSLLQL